MPFSCCPDAPLQRIVGRLVRLDETLSKNRSRKARRNRTNTFSCIDNSGIGIKALTRTIDL
jgi:hypothetical protein